MKIATKIMLATLFPVALCIAFGVNYLYLSVTRAALDEKASVGIEVASRAFELTMLSRDPLLLQGHERPITQWRNIENGLQEALSENEFLDARSEIIRRDLLDSTARLKGIFRELNLAIEQRASGAISPDVFEELRERLFTQTEIVAQSIMTDAVALNAKALEEVQALHVRTSRISLAVTVALTLVAALAFLLFGRGLVRPIHRLQQGAQEIAAGNFAFRTSIGGKDEMADLSRAFDHMAREVQSREDDLVRQAQALAQSEESFRTIVDAAPDALLIADRAGSIELVNPRVETLFGYDRNAIVGQHLSLLLGDRVWGAFVSSRIDSGIKDVHGLASAETEGLGRCRNGSLVPVSIRFAPLVQHGDDMVLAVIRDITELKRAEREILQRTQELERSNEELAQFAYIASHDLQEPLRMVDSYLGLIARRYSGQLDEEADEFIGFATDGARRMKQLINDLLGYSRVSNQPFNFDEVDIGLILRGVVAKLHAVIEETGATVDTGPMPTVPADAIQLDRLFLNLIENAIKYRSDRPPVIRVAAEQQGGMWEFTVTDNGIGIDPKYSSKIFEIFTRLHRRDEYAGTGIGLASCKRIVERHGGAIRFEPNPEGGSIFLFTLPQNQSGEPHAINE